jgi:uncharacterized protein YegJ (DUF2314 family)
LRRAIDCLATFCVVAATACGTAAQSDAPVGKPPVHSVSADGDTALLVASDDAGFARARRDAHCTLHEFRERFRSPPASQSELMLKAAFRDTANVEHLWVRVTDIAGDSLYRGVIENDPATLRHFSFGDTVQVPSADVDDWFAVDRDTLIAGFSLRVYRERLTAIDRAHADSARGYVVDGERSARGRLTWRCGRATALGGTREDTRMIDYPRIALLAAGFALAHAAWSVSDLSDTELLAPLAITEHAGERRLTRFEAATQEAAILRGKAAMAADTESDAWAFAREGSARDPRSGPPQDVLLVDFWARGMTAPLTLIQPFERIGPGRRFRLQGTPRVVDASGRQLAVEQAAAVRAGVLRGVEAHPKVAPLWATWH